MSIFKISQTAIVFLMLFAGCQHDSSEGNKSSENGKKANSDLANAKKKLGQKGMLEAIAGTWRTSGDKGNKMTIDAKGKTKFYSTTSSGSNILEVSISEIIEYEDGFFAIEFDKQHYRLFFMASDNIIHAFDDDRAPVPKEWSLIEESHPIAAGLAKSLREFDSELRQNPDQKAPFLEGREYFTLFRE